jgi:hypothetical protein
MAVRGQTSRDRGADAAPGAGDDRDLAVRSPRHRSAPSSALFGDYFGDCAMAQL